MILRRFKKNLTKEDKLYYFLSKQALGYEKRAKSTMLMKYLDIKDNKTFRKVIENIRNDEKYKYIICSEAGFNGGYWIATNQKEVEETLKHLYKRSMEMLKTYSKIKKKAKLNKQLRFNLERYEVELYETIKDLEK